MSYRLPLDYVVPVGLTALTDNQRAALLDQLATTYEIFKRHDDSAVSQVASRYEERLAQQADVFERAISIATGQSTLEIIERLDQLSGKLAPIDRIFGSTLSSTKGRCTEEFIMSYLAEGRFAAGRIEFMGKTTGQGDLWYTTPSGITILIEIKNKRVITADDIQKFDRDVCQAFADQKIAAALFISLDSRRFPCMASEAVNYRMIAGCPTIHAYIDQLSTLDTVIGAIETIILHGQRCDPMAAHLSYAAGLDDSAELAALKKVKSALETGLADVRSRIATLTERLGLAADPNLPSSRKLRTDRKMKKATVNISSSEDTEPIISQQITTQSVENTEPIISQQITTPIEFPKPQSINTPPRAKRHLPRRITNA